MSHTPHELHEEFPEHADKITALKTQDTRCFQSSRTR